ncbi:hypothetical protein RUND412_010097 [Rhizina undulata]
MAPKSVLIAAAAVMLGACLISAVKAMSTAQVEEKLQNCEIVQQLNALHNDENEGAEDGFMKNAFGILFPFGPAVNSLLATAYISGPPNFILALVPPTIDPSSLSVMVAFAVGGLLGDTLLHLIPQTFMGEHTDGKVHFVMVDSRRNAVLGLFIFLGFGTFVAMDKTMRILSGGDGGHSHSHSHSHSEEAEEDAVTTGAEKGSGELRKRGNGKKQGKLNDEKENKEEGKSIKASSYLNLLADFSHNITDGLAMSAAFYASPTIGATTTLACLVHEIPHEIGDFALLVQSGFTKWQAMGAQFVTAIGAFLGTLIGIAIQHFSAGVEGAEDDGEGIFGTGLKSGDLVLPFTAGTFLYVGFSVVPELLETGRNKREEVKKSFVQAIAMLLGFGIMFGISLAE